MPLIYGTKELEEMARKLRSRYPEYDVILLRNSVMVYAFDASARAIYKVSYPDHHPRGRINLAAANIQTTIDCLVARGLSVAFCDLDAPMKDYLGRNPDEGVTFAPARGDVE
jgi:hypothetical protein